MAYMTCDDILVMVDAGKQCTDFISHKFEHERHYKEVIFCITHAHPDHIMGLGDSIFWLLFNTEANIKIFSMSNIIKDVSEFIESQGIYKIKNTGLENYKNIFLLLEQIVPILDKIGSSTQDKEKVALLLLLFFKEKNVLDILSNIRKTAFSYLEENLSEDELDNLLQKADENFLEFWQIPKETNKELLIEKIISL